MRKQLTPEDFDKMRDDLNNYKWGIYFNPRDKRVIIRRRIQWMGWTLNFANPYSYFFILGLIIIALLIGLYGRL